MSTKIGGLSEHIPLNLLLERPRACLVSTSSLEDEKNYA
jgi:hypothetical protein